MRVSVLPAMCASAPVCAPGACRGQKRRLALLELQLEMVVSFLWVLGVELASSGRAAAFGVPCRLLGETEPQFASGAELITNVVKSRRGKS